MILILRVSVILDLNFMKEFQLFFYVVFSVLFNIIIFEVLPINQIVHKMLIIVERKFRHFGNLLVLFENREFRNLINSFSDIPIFLQWDLSRSVKMHN